MDHDLSSENLMMDVMMHTHYFEMSSTLIVIILLGKFLEALSKKQTVDKLSQLAGLKVSQAVMVRSVDLAAEGEEINVELLNVGDLVRVNYG